MLLRTTVHATITHLSFFFLFFSSLFQEKEFVIPDGMTKYRLCEIADGGHFFVHNAEGGDLALIEAKLKELKDKVGRRRDFFDVIFFMLLLVLLILFYSSW